MKRLFVLRNTDGKVLRIEGTALHFENKQDAKQSRDDYNSLLGRPEWHVSRGEDNLPSAKPHGRTISRLPKYQRGNRGAW